MRGARWGGYKPLSGQQLECPWLASPRSPPPACQPQSSQGRERRALRPLPCPGGWRLALYWVGQPLGEYEGWGLGKLPWAEVWRAEKTAASSRAQCPPAREPCRLPHTHPRSPPLPQLGLGLRGSRQGWGVAPGAEATTPTSRGAFGVSRGMFRQVGVSPASFPLQGPRENSPFTQRLSDNKPGRKPSRLGVGCLHAPQPPTGPPRSPPSPMTPCRAAPSLTSLQA